MVPLRKVKGSGRRGTVGGEYPAGRVPHVAAATGILAVVVGEVPAGGVVVGMTGVVTGGVITVVIVLDGGGAGALPGRHCE